MRIYLCQRLLIGLLVLCWVCNAQILNNWKYRPNKDPKVKNYNEDFDFVKPNETHLEGIPKFVRHPDPVYYVYEDRPATIVCIASPVSHVNIVCNKETTFVYRQEGPSNQFPAGRLKVEKLNQHNKPDKYGVRWQFSVEITYKDLIQWFNTYSCVCEAWNQVPALEQAKKVHSRVTELREAYIKTSFKKYPQSTQIKQGQRLILSCVPPDGKPKPNVEWLKNDKKLFGDDRIRIVAVHKLVIDKTQLSDSGNYSCAALSLDRRILSPSATVKIVENLNLIPSWSSWSKWSGCDKTCEKKRTRVCLVNRNCLNGVNEQKVQCSKVECKNNKIMAPFIKNSEYSIETDGQGPTQEARDIAMYVGLFIAVTVLVMVLTIVFCLVRRKAFINLRNSMRYSLDANGNNISYDAKSSLVKNPPVTIKNPNASVQNQYPGHSATSTNVMSQHQSNVPLLNQTSKPAPTRQFTPPRGYQSNSPPNLPPPTCLSDISSSNNAYSNGIDISYTSTVSGKFSAPQHVSNSSSLTTNHNSKTTSSSNTDTKPDQMSASPPNSRPTSGLYHELSIDRPFIQDNLDPSTIVWTNVPAVGARVCLPQSGVSLTIAPESIVYPGQSNNEVFIAVSRNDPHPLVLNDTETLLSPIVLFGPSNLSLLKPCVVGLPHSAELRQGNWILRLMGCNISENEEPGKWKIISTIGCETEQTSSYTHLDPYYAYTMLEQPMKLCLIGQSYPGGKATKRLRLAVFGRPLSVNNNSNTNNHGDSYLKKLPMTSYYNIRIYVFSDTKEAFENVTSIETKLGSSLLDNTSPINFSDGGGSLYFCIEELSTGWRSQLATKYQEIPFQDIWSGSQSETLHCAFTFDNIDSTQSNFLCRITTYQSGYYLNKRSLSIRQDSLHPANKDLVQYEKILLHSDSANTYLNPLNTGLRISNFTRKKLSLLLDTVTSRGNDWRLLCRQLALNGYTNYLLSKVSPTDALLTLWEARNRQENALSDLINHFKSINRTDCASLLESDCYDS